jgi:2-keto-3-deoxy-L-rhamnonate aldolase RhmA
MGSTALRLRDKIRGGEFVVGMWAHIWSPFMVEQIGLMQVVDFIIVDLEHSPYSIGDTLEFVRAAEIYGLVPWVRIPSPTDEVTIQKAVEMGFKGIVIPHIHNADEVRRAVSAAKYPPEGTRGMSGDLRRLTPRTAKSLVDDMKEMNDEIVISILPLENLESINSIEEILSVPGIDDISLSSGDITLALGHAGEQYHLDVLAVQEKVLRLCKEKNIAAHKSEPKIEKWASWFDKGVRVFLLSDSNIFLTAVGKAAEQFKQFRGKK